MSVDVSGCAENCDEQPDRPSELFPEKRAPTVEPGDFVLSFAQGYYRHQLIKRIQGARLRPEHRGYARYTHAALVVSADGDLLEAYKEGLQLSHLDDLATRPHQIVHITASHEARERAVAVALHAFDRKAGYNAMAIVSAALSALAGSRLVLSNDGAHTCSGLVARALLAVGAIYDTDASTITPARLAIHFGAPEPPEEPLVPRRLRHELMWDIDATAGRPASNPTGSVGGRR